MLLNLKTLKSPSPKNALGQVWLKLASFFWITQKCEKFIPQRRQQRQRPEKGTGTFGSGELNRRERIAPEKKEPTPSICHEYRVAPTPA